MSIDIFSILSGNTSNTLIPNRNSNAVSGSIFYQNNMITNRSIRENNILNEFLSGNIPDFLRKFVPITITEGNDSITYLVTSDVLSIGNDEDYVRIPMQAPSAKKIAEQYDCTLPTKKMCDQIWKEAKIKLEPHPRGAPYDSSMMTTETFIWHNNIIEQQLQGKDKTKLISGHKKDVIIDKSLLLHKDKISIYGWFSTKGIAIQGPQPNSSSHEFTYQDYSQCMRFIAQDIIVNNMPMRFFDILNDNKLCHLISEQGNYDGSQIYK